MCYKILVVDDEVMLTQLLLDHPGQAFDRERIYETLWGWILRDGFLCIQCMTVYI